MKKIITLPEHILPFLSIGRLIYIRNNDIDWGWGVVINFTKKKLNVKKNKRKPVNENIGMLKIKILELIKSKRGNIYC